MPSITIRFDWDSGPGIHRQEHTLRELSAHLQRRVIEAFTTDGEDLMGYDGALIDPVTIDAIIDDGHGITHADREQAARDDERDAKAAALAEEYHTEEP